MVCEMVACQQSHACRLLSESEIWRFKPANVGVAGNHLWLHLGHVRCKPGSEPLLRQPPGPYLLLQLHQTRAGVCIHTHAHTRQAPHAQTHLSLRWSSCSFGRGSPASQFGSRSLVLPGLTTSLPLVGQLPEGRP